MRYLMTGLNCENCLDYLLNNINKASIISKIERKGAKLEIHSDSEKKEIVKHINTILRNINHNHKIEISDLYDYEFYFKGLNCANCSAKIEENIRKKEYIDSENYDFARQKMKLTSTIEDRESLRMKLQDIIDSIEDGVKVVDEIKKDIESEEKTFKNKEIFKFIFTLIMLICLHFIEINNILNIIIHAMLYLLVGKEVLLETFEKIQSKSFLDENFLMTIASLSAFFTGNYEEAVSVMLFYCVGEFLQDEAVERSRKSITKALELKPEYANVIRDGQAIKVDPEDVLVGEMVLIRPGEKVPLDGIIKKGLSEIDTSNITGESVPESVEIGDKLVSGSVNISGAIEMEVLKEYKSGTIANILDMVENASSKKTPVEKFITRFAKYYTPVVVCLAFIIAISLPLFFNYSIKDGIYRACIFLVISCPCALVISVPLGIFAGIGAMSKKAIFVKGGNFIEAISDVKTVVFDKTGTVTEGNFEIAEVIEIKSNREEILKIASIGEKSSTHPIAKAIVKAFKAEENPEDLKNLGGKGIEFKYNGEKILLGNEKILIENNIEVPIKDVNSSYVHVYVAKNREVLGTILLKDKIKKDAKKDIKALHDMGIKTVMLSGDREDIVKEVSNVLAIDDYYGALLPLDKVDILEDIMKKSDHKVAFVGDGTNDAPVLARADVGFSMGSGSDIAVESSDVVLLKSELSKIIDSVKISKKTKRIVFENIAIALILKVVILILGAFGMASMFMAVFADVGVALICILNSIRILGVK